MPGTHKMWPWNLQPTIKISKILMEDISLGKLKGQSSLLWTRMFFQSVVVNTIISC